MDSFLMFLNINCHKQRLFPEIGVGVIHIVVSPVNTKNGAMECLCYKAHAMVISQLLKTISLIIFNVVQIKYSKICSD